MALHSLSDRANHLGPNQMRVIEVSFLSSERLTGTGSLESVSGDSSSGLFWIVQVTDLHLSAEDEEERTLGAFSTQLLSLGFE